MNDGSSHAEKWMKAERDLALRNALLAAKHVAMNRQEKPIPPFPYVPNKRLPPQ